MKKIFKRVSAAVMALAVVLTAVVFDLPGKPTAAAVGVLNLDSYCLDDYGKLTIKNDTGMTNWTEKRTDYYASLVKTVEMQSRVTSIPDKAFYKCSNLTSITIPSGVTSIGSNAFYNCSNLMSITFDGESELTSIGYNAFNGCSVLERITIPDTVTSIGDSAFSGCTGLRVVDIPVTLTSISHYLFKNCSSLESINIPMTVTSIQVNAFSGCSSLAQIIVDESNSNYSSGDGVLFNKDKTKLLRCPAGKQNSYVIPNSVTSIGSNAFSGCDLTSIEIPDSVASVDNGAFSGCKRLASINIPNSVTSVGSDAFSVCSNLTSVTISNNVTSVSAGVFNGCSSITSITIPSGVTSIGGSAFYNCTGLTSITIPSAVTSIGSSAFSNCTGLTSITIPSSVTSIKSNAFKGCTNLSEIIYPSSATVGSNAISKAITQVKYTETDSKRNVTEITLGTNKTSLTVTDAMGISFVAEAERGKVSQEGHTHNYSNRVCQICNAIDNSCGANATWAYDDTTKTLTISGTGAMTDWEKKDNVPWADKAADIQKVVIDSGITSIGERAFYDCKNLASIEIPNTVTSIKTCAFINCQKLASITIPGGVTSIENNVFQNCSSLSSITIPDNVTSIGVYAFDSTSLSSIIIPEKVTSIGLGAFSHCENLTSITIPKNVTTINNAVFFYCTNLETVTFENATPPTPMGTTVFKSCDKLTKIIVPAGSVEDYKAATGFTDYADIITDGTPDNKCGDNATWAYDEATNTLTISGTGTMTDWTDTTSVPWADKAADIQKVVIGDGITSIGDNAFNGCSSLTNVTISKDVTTIGKGAFNGCSNLANVTLPDSVTTISSGAFMSCTSLTGITIPKNVTTIGNNAFDSCTNLETVTFEGTTPPTTIGSNVFNECSSDLTINVPEGTKDAYKTKLADLSDKVTDGTPDNKCGANATWALDETTKTLTISGTGDMSNWVASGNVAPWLKDTGNIGKIKNVVINEGITSVGNYAFCRCLLLTSVTIPSSVTFIGDCAFNSCSALTSITIPSSVTSIGSSAFFNCGNLTSITIPKDVRSIGTSAFDRCSKLSEIIYKDGLDVSRTSIPDTATKVEYTVNNSKLNVTKITLGTGKTSFTVTDEMNISFVAETYRTNVSQTGHSHIYSGDVCQICDCEKPDNSCGANAAWEYDETTKTLTISGTGDMNDWTAEDSAPWADKAADIEKVVIGDGITLIGDNAFEGCTGLTDVTIPDSVTDIGNGAFDGCTSLTEVTIPEGVENIGDNAFAGCTDLETVTFEGKNPPAIGSDVFNGCNVDKIVVPEGSEDTYKGENGFTDLTDKITAGTGDNSGSDDGNTDKPENPGDNDDNNNNDSGNSSGGSESNDSGNSGDTGNNSSDNENTSKDVLLGENVPKTDFATPTEELISAVLDPEEITQIKNSDEVSIVLEISDTVSNEDKQKVESALETNAELRFAQYMDIALYKVINDIKTQVTTTNKPIRITFEVPANLRKSGRTFGVYRVHNGETVLLPDLDNDENTVTIETDRFSTYALVYRDKASASESGNPSTGIAVSLIPLVTAAAILMIMTNRKKK